MASVLQTTRGKQQVTICGNTCALEEHIKRVRLQSRVWCQATVMQQQPFEPLEFGYCIDTDGLRPVTTKILPTPQAIIDDDVDSTSCVRRSLSTLSSMTKTGWRSKVRQADISDLISNIPSWFWYSRPVHSLPTNKFSRRATCYDSFDLFHSHLCVTKTYHSCPTDTCICSYCSAPASHYHHRSCSILHTLSPPQLLSLLTM
ncbi:hypothetical protein GQR58_017625 [Nymphon striatum]|nr:hypothetical protein GQR58_017625 [Nymphon striatum]